jgi:hypothetical protein
MAAAKKTVRSLAETSEDKWDVLSHVVLSYNVFPNLAVNLHGDHAAIYRIVPDSQRPDRCYWHFSMLVPDEPQTEQSRQYFDKNFDYIVGTGHEDVAMAQATQQTLRSGANTSLVYSRYEPVLAWYHQRIADTVYPSSRPD